MQLDLLYKSLSAVLIRLKKKEKYSTFLRYFFDISRKMFRKFLKL